jgi:translation initiation factor 2B subunit (eIF-2B alpha/beta/delta family)
VEPPPYDDRVDDAWARVERAAGDMESGAAQIARRAAAALAALRAERIPEAVETLLRGHPTMAPLWRLANDVLSATDPAGAAGSFLRRLDDDGEAGTSAANVLPGRILTLSYSSTLVAAIRLRRPLQTVCMWSEPGGEGWRVAEETRDVTTPILMDDDEALEQLPAEAVLVGADAVTPDGVVNKVKTRALAEAARAKGIPRYTVAGTTKFVGATLPLRPGFEVTPLELFTAIAVPRALMSPTEARVHAEAFRLRDELLRLLEDLSRT